jgi:membrane protease YdiL (CAAX protease family)
MWITAQRLLRPSLWEVSPRDHRQSAADFRRRRLVAVLAAVAGAAVLGWSLRIEPGSTWFYVATLALAAVWSTGAFISGPVHLGRIAGDSHLRRPLVEPILIGLVLAGVFVLGALVVREVPTLDGQVRDVLEHARRGSAPLVLLSTVAVGVSEELFFRGAVYAAVRRHQVPVTTTLYVLATAVTGNLMLSFAAVVLGVVVGLQRRASGGVLAPVLTHVTWSVVMLYALPAIFL